MQESAPEGVALERFRGYLLLLARQHWDPRLQGQHDPSDLVQQALLEAHERFEQFRGTSEAELAGWLRTILAHNLADARRRLDTAKRDPRRERPIELALEESSARLMNWLADEQSSPSKRAAKQELMNRLADSLNQLPDAQREAVTLHHLQGLQLAEVAGRMGRTEASVAGLLRRGLKRLRELMDNQE
jgi:RNA polymerase sigma-70 factor (ECF subfamily)